MVRYKGDVMGSEPYPKPHYMQTTSVNTERMASRAAVIANVRGLRELKERNRLEAEEQEG